MGGNMVRRLMRGGHQCTVFDLNPENVRQLVGEGAAGASSMEDFVKPLSRPRAAWVMVPAGNATEATVMQLANLMEPGDTIIDGGNSYCKDDVRRAKELEPTGIHYVDVGTSGGVWGLQRGYCMTIGGPDEAVKRLHPIFVTLAPGMGDIPRTPGRDGRDGTAEQGYLHCGPSGSGHFVKTIHNGIEYGLMQAYAEGFDKTKRIPVVPRAEEANLTSEQKAGAPAGHCVIAFARKELACEEFREKGAFPARSFSNYPGPMEARVRLRRDNLVRSASQ